MEKAEKGKEIHIQPLLLFQGNAQEIRAKQALRQPQPRKCRFRLTQEIQRITTRIHTSSILDAFGLSGGLIGGLKTI